MIAANDLPFTEGDNPEFPNVSPTSVLNMKLLRIATEGDLNSKVIFLPGDEEATIQTIRFVAGKSGNVTELKVLCAYGIPPWHGEVTVMEAARIFIDNQ